MASYSAVLSTHKSTAAGVVDVVTLDRHYQSVEIINHDPTNVLYATVNGNNPVDTVPTVGGDSTYFVGTGATRVISQQYVKETAVVNIISVGIVAYSVTGLVSW